MRLKANQIFRDTLSVKLQLDPALPLDFPVTQANKSFLPSLPATPDPQASLPLFSAQPFILRHGIPKLPGLVA